MQDLDDLFATAVAQPAAVPSAALMARVLGDAAREQALPVMPALTAQSPTPVRPGFWARLAGLFGGGGVLAGLGSAAVAGLYLGFAQPAAMLQFSDVFVGAGSLDSVDLMPGVDALMSEE